MEGIFEPTTSTFATARANQHNPDVYPQKCTYCGHESVPGDEVKYFNVHVGGQGEVHRPECVNLPRCWRRLGW